MKKIVLNIIHQHLIIVSCILVVLLVLAIILFIRSRNRRSSSKKTTIKWGGGINNQHKHREPGILESDQFYMGIPTNQGFESKNMSPVYDKNTSVFIFTKNKNNKKTASYKAIIGEFTLQLLKNNSHNENLKNACFFTGDPIEKSSTFVTIEEGNAAYDRGGGGRWLIVRKTRICLDPRNHNGKNENPEVPKGQNTLITNPSPIEESKSNTTNPQIPFQQQIKQESKQTSKFYMGMPDGSLFPIYSKSLVYKTGISMFELTETGKNTAKFKMISDVETIKFIKNTFIDNIKPACIINNLPNNDTTKIETIEFGIAVFDGENWKIEKQATIKFE